MKINQFKNYSLSVPQKVICVVNPNGIDTYMRATINGIHFESHIFRKKLAEVQTRESKQELFLSLIDKIWEKIEFDPDIFEHICDLIFDSYFNHKKNL